MSDFHYNSTSLRYHSYVTKKLSSYANLRWVKYKFASAKLILRGCAGLTSGREAFMPNGASLRVQRMWIAGTVFSITGYHRAVTRRFRFTSPWTRFTIFYLSCHHICTSYANSTQFNTIILIWWFLEYNCLSTVNALRKLGEYVNFNGREEISRNMEMDYRK